MSVIFLVVASLFVAVALRGESHGRARRACLGSLCFVAGVSALLCIGSDGFLGLATPLGAQEQSDEVATHVEGPENSPENALPFEKHEPSGVTSSSTGRTTAPSLTAEDASLAPAPATKVVIPPGRPAWVESAAVRDGNVHQTPVSSGPHARRRECDRALDDEIAAAVKDYVNWYLESSTAATMVHYNLNDIKKRLIPSENYYFETIEVSIGQMHQGHALLRFDKSFQKELEDRWNQITVTSRLLQAGLSGAGVLALLGMLFGYFRLDTATRGYYTGRLQFVSVAAILALIGLGVFAGSRFGDLLLLFL